MTDNTPPDAPRRVRMIVACSGASPAGRLADLTARRLVRDGKAKLVCLAGLGSHTPEVIAVVQRADVLLAIEGCPRHCARRVLEQAGIPRYRHFCVAEEPEVDDTGSEDEVVGRLAAKATETLLFGEPVAAGKG